MRSQNLVTVVISSTGVLGGIVLLAVIFALSRQGTGIEFWIRTWWIFLLLLFLFGVDVFLRHWLIVKCPSSKPTFGGFWLTKRARAILRGTPEAYANKDLAKGDTPPPSAAALYCSFSPGKRDKTRVWPSASTAAATALIVLVYCLWNVLTIGSLVLAATMVVVAVGS